MYSELYQRQDSGTTNQIHDFGNHNTRDHEPEHPQISDNMTKLIADAACSVGHPGLKVEQKKLCCREGRIHRQASI